MGLCSECDFSLPGSIWERLVHRWLQDGGKGEGSMEEKSQIAPSPRGFVCGLRMQLTISKVLILCLLLPKP